MTSQEQDLEWLIEAVADGGDIDWSNFNDESPNLGHGMLSGLREIQSITKQFRRGNALPADDDEPLPSQGFTFDRLKLIERIGRDAESEVWKAYDPILERHVALKLHENEASGFSSHMKHEAQNLAKFRHPNILCIHGAATDKSYSGLWTDLIVGQSLAALLAENGPFPIDEALAIGATLCRTLAVVHGAGDVHCDVKLENIMREDDGRIVIVDFGSARPRRHSSRPVFGTPSYAAPELFVGAPPSVASDVFALGVLLFRLTTGIFPYSAENARELVELHSRGEQCDVTALAPKLPRAFAEVLQRALQVQPHRRFNDMAQFARALANT